MDFSESSFYEIFEFFSTVLENYLTRFFCTLQFPKATFGYISSKIFTIFLEFPERNMTMFRIFEKIDFKPNVQKIFLLDRKYAAFFKSTRRSIIPVFFLEFLVEFSESSIL